MDCASLTCIHFGSKGVVDHPMPLNNTGLSEALTDNSHLEVCFNGVFATHGGMARVLVALVLYDEVLWLKGRSECAFDPCEDRSFHLIG